MKNISLLILLVCPLLSFSQVGIGTTNPNSNALLDISSTTKGLLIPRMTAAQRLELELSAADAGMMVFQTDLSTTPKGLYVYDGSNWCAPLLNGTSNGQTLKWDGNKWLATSNLFNQGTSIGIGTVNPKTQFHIHSSSISPTTRLQITNPTTGALTADGLILGIDYSTANAHLIQQETKALWFATDSIERLRIDSAGNIGINKTNPSARLDVNGTVKLGTYGSELNSIMRQAVMIDLPEVPADTSQTIDIPFENALTTATVHISPGDNMTDMMIAYARVSAPGNVQVKFMNMSAFPNDLGEIMFYITVIQ